MSLVIVFFFFPLRYLYRAGLLYRAPQANDRASVWSQRATKQAGFHQFRTSQICLNPFSDTPFDTDSFSQRTNLISKYVLIISGTPDTLGLMVCVNRLADHQADFPSSLQYFFQGRFKFAWNLIHAELHSIIRRCWLCKTCGQRRRNVDTNIPPPRSVYIYSIVPGAVRRKTATDRPMFPLWQP